MKFCDFYRKNKKFPIVICAMTVLCLFISIPTYFYPELYSIFALWTQPKHLWQYITFIFEHGVEPRWFLWLHLGMNLMGLLPFGILVEKMFGSKKTIAVFGVEWIVTIALFQILRNGQYTSMAGISSIGYAYATIAFAYFIKIWRIERKKMWFQPLTYFYIFEIFGMITMLNPLMTGWVSLWIHLSGICVGGLFVMINWRYMKP